MLHQIGNGASGPVFRAFDQDRDRLVAIKLFRLDLPPERVHQLAGEFEKLIAVELQHPVIAAPRATGIDGNSAYLAQDFVSADSLDVVMRESGAAPAAEALRVAGQLAEALDYAADRHVVHGALHPRDILLSQDDIRIVGLGVARALEHVGVTAPVRRPYAPPERINDSGWDRSADVFSLAAIVFEFLSGKRVSGTGSEAAEGLTGVAGDLESVQRVFALALAADPAYRYTTATAFTDALKDAMGVETAPKPKVTRARPRLRVVAPDAPSDVALPLDEEVPEVPEVQEISEPEPVAVRKPRRRRVPAPTPVAIETMATPLPAPSEVEGPAPVLDPELVIEPDAFGEPEAFVEPEIALEPEVVVEEPLLVIEPPALSEVEGELVADLHAEFAPVEPEPEPPIVLPFEPALGDLEAPVPSPGFFMAPELEPSPEPEINEREIARLLAAPELAEPEIAEAEIAKSPIAESSNAGSPVWPIGVAAVLGIALGFGAGYTIAIRDRAVAPAAATVAVTPQPAGKQFTEVAAAPQPVAPKPAVESTLAKAGPKPSAIADVAPKPALDSPQAKADVQARPGFLGSLLVRSTPSGAHVLVDGNDRGPTPATIRELGQGEHRIRIVREGYTAAERRVVLSPSRPSQSMSVALAREPRPVSPKLAVETTPAKAEAAGLGTLIVESRPAGATVLIDGRAVGTTPLNLGDVRVGNHAVRIERDGYRIWTASIKIAASEQNRVTASLEK